MNATTTIRDMQLAAIAAAERVAPHCARSLAAARGVLDGSVSIEAADAAIKEDGIEWAVEDGRDDGIAACHASWSTRPGTESWQVEHVGMTLRHARYAAYSRAYRETRSHEGEARSNEAAAIAREEEAQRQIAAIPEVGIAREFDRTMRAIPESRWGSPEVRAMTCAVPRALWTE